MKLINDYNNHRRTLLQEKVERAAAVQFTQVQQRLSGGLTSEERSRRNQEFAELTSEINMAVMNSGMEDGEELGGSPPDEDDIEEILRRDRPPEENARRLAEVGRATAREGVRRLADGAQPEARGEEEGGLDRHRRI